MKVGGILIFMGDFRDFGKRPADMFGKPIFATEK
jgi:hypothetical protein